MEEEDNENKRNTIEIFLTKLLNPVTKNMTKFPSETSKFIPFYYLINNYLIDNAQFIF